MMLDKICLKSLVVECIVGVYPAERITPQPLTLDLELFLNTRPAGGGGGLSLSVDYARLCGELEFLLKSCRFRLLEEAAEVLCRYLLAPPAPTVERAQIEALTLTLTKKNALGGRAVPSLCVHRKHDEYDPKQEVNDFGLVDFVAEVEGCGVYRLRVAPGRSIPTHVHRVMEECELILTDGLLLQGTPVRAGSAFAWPLGFPHHYANPSAKEQVILCVDRPAFIRKDEIPDPTPLEELSLPQSDFYFPLEET